MNYPNTIGGWAILVVIVAAIIGVVLVALPVFGVAVPGWIIHILWILLAAVIVIGAIKFLLGLGGSGST